MTLCIKLRIAALLALALVGLLTGIGWAGSAAFTIVNIDDLTDTPSVTLSGGVPPGLTPTILPDTAGEFLHFTLPTFSVPLASFYTDLFEDVVGGTLSDRLLVTHAAGTPIVDVKFASDPATVTLPPGAINLFSLVETGAFQFAGELGEYRFQVRSDRADVPAPAALLLLGSGLIALGGATWRRGRKEAARREGKAMAVGTKFRFTALLALALVGLLSGISWAGAVINVRIDDLTDTPSVTLQFAPPSLAPTILPDTAGEFLHFTLPVSPIQLSVTSYSDLFEDFVGGTLSDRFLLTYVAGSNIVDVKFASDPATIILPPGASNFVNRVEDGTFQFVGPFDVYDFFVRSDRADVPAPATALLLGSGLIAVGGAMLRRGRRA